ncbi:MAG: hypothetical protein M3N10_10260 [Actinomycetota bacterium]|nr:hypothetical protein [Actinomycetota bacterium]HZY64990.1 hypothetical protein [Rubrobacteraceae bacterium]
MSEEKPQHPQGPTEGNEEDVGASGAERAGSTENEGDEARPSTHPQESAEGDREDVDAQGAERAGDD